MIKNDLTKKQINIILTIVFLIVLILPTFIVILTSNNINSDYTVIYALFLSVISAIIITFLAYMLLDNRSKEMQEQRDKLKNKFSTLFKELNTFYKVELSVSSSENPISSKTKIFLEIVKNEGYKFYAELLEDESIHLICKDSSDKIIYDKNIKDYFYFDANFKFIPQNSR